MTVWKWAHPYCGKRQWIKTRYGLARTDHFCGGKPPGHDGDHQCACGWVFPDEEARDE